MRFEPKNYFGKRLLTTIGSAALSCLAGQSVADPFDWQNAQITTGNLQFENGETVRYKVGHFGAGNYTEVAVVIDHEPAGIDASDQEIIHRIETDLPIVGVDGNFLIITSTGVPWGSYKPVTSTNCWRSGITFTQVDCPASLTP